MFGPVAPCYLPRVQVDIKDLASYHRAQMGLSISNTIKTSYCIIILKWKYIYIYRHFITQFICLVPIYIIFFCFRSSSQAAILYRSFLYSLDPVIRQPSWKSDRLCNNMFTEQSILSATRMLMIIIMGKNFKCKNQRFDQKLLYLFKYKTFLEFVLNYWENFHLNMYLF